MEEGAHNGRKRQLPRIYTHKTLKLGFSSKPNQFWILNRILLLPLVGGGEKVAPNGKKVPSVLHSRMYNVEIGVFE